MFVTAWWNKIAQKKNESAQIRNHVHGQTCPPKSSNSPIFHKCQAPSFLLLLPLFFSVLIFDSHLSFKEHSIVESCSHLIWAIRHIRPLLSVEPTSALARSLVLCRLDYFNSLLYGTSASFIHSLQREQPTLNSTDCLKQLLWLPIHNSIIFKIALMTYRVLATSNPQYLILRHAPGLRSSSNIQPRQPVRKSSLVNIGFSYASPAVWIALPPQVRDQPSLELFERHLKTHLFRTPTRSQRRHKAPLKLCNWRITNELLLIIINIFNIINYIFNYN